MANSYGNPVLTDAGPVALRGTIFQSNRGK